jgi:hypothetical protein
MASNVFSQSFATQAPFGDLTLADNTGAGGLLSFQDFPASQDHYYEFNDFSQVCKCILLPLHFRHADYAVMQLPSLVLPA